MAKFSDMLVYLRKRANMSQQELAAATGVKRSALSMYETGKREPDFETLEIFADYFNVSMDVITGRGEAATRRLPPEAIPIDPAHFQRIPILGYISAGLPLYAEEHIEGYTYTDLNGGAEYFALRVKGDSMNAIGINDGYQIIVRRQEEVENGEIAVVMVGDEDATVKRFYRTETSVTLMPQSTNPVHQPQIYNLSKTAINVLGKVVKVEFVL